MHTTIIGGTEKALDSYPEGEIILTLIRSPAAFSRLRDYGGRFDN